MEIENLRLQKEIDSIIDKIYPVGSFYDTTEASFNPNEVWGGTWEKITDGTVLIAGGNIEGEPMVLLGGTIGKTSVTLTRNNIPVHGHELSNAVAKMYIGSNRIDYTRVGTTAYETNVRSDKANSSYYESINEYGNGIGINGSTDFEILDPDPETSNPSPSSFNIIQPSMVVARWHRTA